MNSEVEMLKQNAENYRALYNLNQCTREEAKENIIPYINTVNEKAKILSEKYNQKYKPITFNSFIR